MAAVYKPGCYGTKDETGVKWHGGEGEGDYRKCPHISWVPRKPEPYCALFNTAGDAQSGVMMYMEFEKKAKYHADTKYMETIKTYNAALSVRCSDPFAFSNAIDYGDSRFGSVKAAYYEMNINRVHSAFDIKTGSADGFKFVPDI